jgi:hypothetical protein
MTPTTATTARSRRHRLRYGLALGLTLALAGAGSASAADQHPSPSLAPNAAEVGAATAKQHNSATGHVSSWNCTVISSALMYCDGYDDEVGATLRIKLWDFGHGWEFIDGPGDAVYL